MIKVGFVINYRLKGWLGVSNYYKNLFNSLKLIKNNRIVPVIISDKQFTKEDSFFFQGVDIVTTDIINRRSRVKKIINYLLFFFFGKNIFFDNFLKKKKIFIISHTSSLGKKSEIISLKWFPDFQEFHLPNFFSRKQLMARSHDIKIAENHSTKIILSSSSVRLDLKKINYNAYKKSIVFKHVNEVENPNKLKNTSYLKKKYNIKDNFFYMPNHFWKHKNHIIVLKALNFIKDKKIDFQIVSTGSINDYRFPDHFIYLKNYIKENKIENFFKILGIVPYHDVLSLILRSIALINPSLSEGWSNTVDQANCYGKKILLSNIEVHKEQRPINGVFFDPNNYENLGLKLLNIAKNKKLLKKDKKKLQYFYQKSQKLRIECVKKYEEFLVNLAKKKFIC